MQVRWAVIVLLALACAGTARTDTRAGKNKSTPAEKKADTGAEANKSSEPTSKEDTGAAADISATRSEVKELREMLLEQARQLQAQQEKIRDQQQRMEQLETELHMARGNGESVATVNPRPATESKAPAAGASPAVTAQYSEGESKQKSPLSFKIGNADFTPGGFLDFTSVFRTRNVGSGIGTSFGAIPYNTTLPAGSLTESRFTAQNSRLSLKVNAKYGAQDITGYVESDFLGFQPPNANTTSNSNSLRLRLYFVDIKRDKWEVQGGQMWTWLTPNRVGLSPMPADIFYSQNMDTNYQVGLTWARQTAFRVAYHATPNWAFGISLENPQQFVPSSVVFPTGTASFSSQFDNGSGSTSAGSSSTNPATPNLHPDIIGKIAFDGHAGTRAMHVEAVGLVRSFKVFNSVASTPTTDTITGGGGSVNMNLEIFKNFHVIANTFYSYGGGRYIFGLGPDVIVRETGNLSGVHSGSGIGGFEWTVTPRSLLYGYYGGAYFQRNFGFATASSTSSCAGISGFSCVGFGFPGSSGSANRAVQEGTAGVIKTLWRDPTYGALQIITQGSYVTRAPWSVATGAPKSAHVVLVYADLRYVLP